MTPTRSPYLLVSYAETNRIFREPYQKYLAALSLAGLLAMPAFGGEYMLHLCNLAFLAIIGAIGLNLLSGFCGQISLGHAGFLAIGAYSTVILVKYVHAPFWFAVPMSCVFGALLGVVVGLSALRFRGIYLAIVTLAMHYAIVFLLTTYQVNFASSATAGIMIPTATIGPIVFSGERSWYYFLFLVVVGVVVFALNLVRTRPGRAWIAIRDRDIAAESLGIDLARGAGRQPWRLFQQRGHDRGIYDRLGDIVRGDDHCGGNGIYPRFHFWRNLHYAVAVRHRLCVRVPAEHLALRVDDIRGPGGRRRFMHHRLPSVRAKGIGGNLQEHSGIFRTLAVPISTTPTGKEVTWPHCPLQKRNCSLR